MINTANIIPKFTHSRPAGRKLPSSRGNVLVYLVVLLLIFGVLGVTVASLFKTATLSSATPNDARRAQYLAESGIRYALSEVRNSKDLEATAASLNTRTFTVDGGGSFEARVFSPGLKISNIAGSTLTLDVPYSGEFPSDFSIPNATVVYWQSFKGPSPNPESFAAFTVTTQDADAVTIDIADTMSGVKVNDMVCLAVLASEDQSISRGGSVKVVEEAKNFLPAENGAARIVLINPPSGQATYEVYYEKAVAQTGYVELTNIRELPGATWPGPFSLTTSDYVVLSPYNFRVFGTGISGDATVEIGKNWPFWAIAIPSDYTIYMGDLVSDEGGSIVQAGGVVQNFAEEGSKRIELGKGSTGSEGFGTVWYGGNKPIGGDANFCQEGRCELGDGVRVFFTAVISGDGEGFTFALIAGGDLTIPVNTRNSAGGDYQLPELLAYGGAGLQESGLLLDPSQPGLLPPKMALEFDTRTNLVTPLDYCNGSDLQAGSRNDPQPGGTDKNVLQYVFWGSNNAADLGAGFCRTAAIETYDDNRHDAEGNIAPNNVSLNWFYDVGVAVQTWPAIGSDGTIYMVMNGVLYAFNPDGSFKWAREKNDDQVLRTSAAVYPTDDTIFAVGNSNKVYAFDPDDGSAKNTNWPFSAGGQIDVTPTIGPDGNIYVGRDWESDSNKGRVFALDKNGNQISGWPYIVPTVGDNDIDSSPAVASTGGILAVYGASEDLNLYALDANGILQWSFPTGYILAQYSAAIGSDGMVYVGSNSDKLYAFKPADRKMGLSFPTSNEWSFTTGGDIRSTATIGSDGTIYFGSRDDHLYALNPADRRAGLSFPTSNEWVRDLGGDVDPMPVLDNNKGAIYVGSTTHKIYGINQTDGTIRWEYLTGGIIRSTAAIGNDGSVYMGSDDGRLYALAPVALPRNFRISYATSQHKFQKAFITSQDLDSTVVVDNPDHWMKGSITKGPWAIRVEIERAQSVNANNKYEYTLRTWMRQCVFADCSDIKGTPYQDTTVVYDATPANVTELPFTQVIELTAAEQADFERFLFGFTTAAAAGDNQLTTISDFQLTFARPGLDPVITSDPGWNPP